MSFAKHGLQVFDIPITVLPSDIDDNDHVNNVVYLRWIFDVALAHWNASAPDAMKQLYGWVATRHEIDYRREAVFGDAIVARTWIGAVDSRRFERHTEIVRLRCSRPTCTRRKDRQHALRHSGTPAGQGRASPCADTRPCHAPPARAAKSEIPAVT